MGYELSVKSFVFSYIYDMGTLMTNMQDNICQRVLKNTQDPVLYISERRVFTNTQIHIATSRVLANMKDPVSQI